MLPALAGLVAGLAYAAISLYWAVGGRWLLTTVGISLSQPGQAGHLAALLAVWGAAAVKAVATVLPLLAIGVWPRTANGGLRRLARVLTWIETAILTGYGLILTASGLLVQAGVIKAAAHADRLALRWHACHAVPPGYSIALAALHCCRQAEVVGWPLRIQACQPPSEVRAFIVSPPRARVPGPANPRPAVTSAAG